MRLSGLTIVDKVQRLKRPLDHETEYFSSPSLYTDVALYDFSFINSPLFLFLSRALGGLLRGNRGSVNKLLGLRPWGLKSRPPALQQSSNTSN